MRAVSRVYTQSTQSTLISNSCDTRFHSESFAATVDDAMINKSSQPNINENNRDCCWLFLSSFFIQFRAFFFLFCSAQVWSFAQCVVANVVDDVVIKGNGRVSLTIIL